MGAVTSGGDDEPASSGADGTRSEPAEKDTAKKEPDKAKKEPKEQTSAAPAPAQEEQAPAAGAGGAELNQQGFDLMNQGRYDEAIPILQQAVESFPKGTSDLNYAYALFNLGKSLRMVGRYDEAIQVLEPAAQDPEPDRHGPAGARAR